MPRVESRIGVVLLAFFAGGVHAGDSRASDPTAEAPATQPGFTIRGTVEGSTGSPIDAFTLTVLRWAKEPVVYSLQDAGGRLDVQADQSFAVLVVRADGHVAWPHSESIAVGETYDIGRVRLEEARVLIGHVIDAVTGLPIAGARVGYAPPEMRFASIRDEDRLLTGSSATSNEGGLFTLPGLPMEPVYLQVSAAGYADDPQVALFADREQLDIRLGTGATVEGSLLLPGHLPASGTVSLGRGAPWRGTRQQVDQQGRFRFEYVTPGSYRLGAHSPAGVVEPRSVTVDHGEHMTFELGLDPLGKVSGWISGLTEAETASITLEDDGGHRRYSRSSQHRFGNGHFELHGLPDGEYVVKAGSGERSRIAKTIVVDGVGTVDFDFSGRSRLAGVVHSGTRALSRMNVRVLPDGSAHYVGWTMTDNAGRFEFNGLGDGEYEVEVQLGLRGTWRSFAVTVFGETVFDVRLGPYSISGRLAPGFRNHVVQARPLSAHGEPDIHRVFVDGSGGYRFDGLEQGDYLVSHSSPYYTGAREVSLFAASVEGVDFEPAYDQGLAVPVVDAQSHEPVESATCDINEGPWAGESLHQNRRQKLRFPTNLTHTDMTCVSEGYEPVPVRWDGGPVSLELTPTGIG